LYFNVFENVFYSCDGKAEFSESILICWFGGQETFLLPMLKTVAVLNIFVETVLHFFQDLFYE